METFSFNPSILLVEEGEWLLAKTFIEATKFVYNITNGNKIFQVQHQFIRLQKMVKNFLTSKKNIGA